MRSAAAGGALLRSAGTLFRWRSLRALCCRWRSPPALCWHPFPVAEPSCALLLPAELSCALLATFSGGGALLRSAAAGGAFLRSACTLLWRRSLPALCCCRRSLPYALPHPLSAEPSALCCCWRSLHCALLAPCGGAFLRSAATSGGGGALFALCCCRRSLLLKFLALLPLSGGGTLCTLLWAVTSD